MKRFINCRLVYPDRIVDHGALLEKDGKIAWLGLEAEMPEVDAEQIDCAGQYLAPGFIDLHTHGAGGGSFMLCDEEQHVLAMKTHLSHGVTSIAPTLMLVEDAENMRGFANLRQRLSRRKDLPHHLGYFMEGPYFSLEPSMLGAAALFQSRLPKTIDPAYYQAMTEAAGGSILRWMTAPEREGALELGSYLRKQGIIPCMGHSQATYPQILEAMKHGYSCVTHLFTTMSTITRKSGFRTAGLQETALLEDDLYVEIIADGCHVPPELLRLAVKVKGYDKLMLVSDSSELADLPDGAYQMLGTDVIVEDGVCKMPDRSCFAGSVACGDRLVRTMYKMAGVPLWAAVRMATKTPAAHCNLSGKTGELICDAAADLVVFDEDIKLSKLFVDGCNLEIPTK